MQCFRNRQAHPRAALIVRLGLLTPLSPAHFGMKLGGSLLPHRWLTTSGGLPLPRECQSGWGVASWKFLRFKVSSKDKRQGYSLIPFRTRSLAPPSHAHSQDSGSTHSPPCTSYTSHAPKTIMSYAPPLHTQPTPSPHRVLLAQHTTDPPNLLLLLRELLVCRTPRETSRLARERVACPISASVCRYASILRACRETLLFDHARHPVSSHLLIGSSHPSAGG